MKLLLVAHVDGHIQNFHIPYIKAFVDKGYTVDVASNGIQTFKHANMKFNVPFARSPIKFNNIKSFFMLRKIFEQDYYNIVYCNTPIAGAIARIASLTTRKKGTKVIYSAHGFNFYNGENSFKNFIFSKIERFLSKYTDYIITMNSEDYNNCLRMNFKCSIVNVSGVGINKDKYPCVSRVEKERIRKLYGYNNQDFILIYPAELTKRKNQLLLFNIINKVKNEIPNIKLLLPGKGSMEQIYEDRINELELTDYVTMLGYRNDIPDLLKMSDVLIASSVTEGLPINLIEAMSSGLPIIATKARGHVDLIKENKNGFLFDFYDIDKAALNLIELYKNKDIYQKMSMLAVKESERYDIQKVIIEYLDLIEKMHVR